MDLKKPKEELIELLKEGKIIPFIGAGVPRAVAGLPGWGKLIENGLDYAISLRIDRNSDIPKAKELLGKGRFLEASEHLKKVLQYPGYPYLNWIKSQFGNINPRNLDLISSILDLCAPIIVTTNYDTLLSKVDNLGNREKFTHVQYNEALNAMERGKDVVLHLHGIYEKPESIILSQSDYDELNNDLGYKSFVQKLISDYHLLFIGCSRDGVMDADFSTLFNFTKQWFAASGRQHYILLHEQEIANYNHLELLATGNIQAISYGSNHKNLPGFIKEINPNIEKRIAQIESYEDIARQELERLRRNPDNQSGLARELLTDHGWVSPQKLEIFRKVLAELNANMQTRKAQLEFTQAFVRDLFKSEQLKEKVNLWTQYYDRPEKLDPPAYISTAILAYKCLEMIPSKIQEDMRLSKMDPLHHYFHDGYLGRFIREINLVKDWGMDLNEYYKDDKYLFENLKRIIKSLFHFIEFNSDNLYTELEEAQIVNKLPHKFLVVATELAISIRGKNGIDEVLAQLPIRQGFPIRRLHAIEWKNTVYIIAQTERYCLYWRPCEDLSATYFIESDGKPIHDVFCRIGDDEHLHLTVYHDNHLKFFIDFKPDKTKKLPQKLHDLHPFKDGHIGRLFVDSFAQGDFLFFIDKDYKLHSLLSVYALQKAMTTAPQLDHLVSQERLQKHREKMGIGHLNLIDNFGLDTFTFKNEQYVLLRCSTEQKIGIITILKIEEAKVTELHFWSLQESTSLAWDFSSLENDMTVVFGYLDLFRKTAMAEMLFIDKLKIKSNRIIEMERGDLTMTRDIYNICFIPDEAVIMQEEGHRLHRYDLQSESFDTVVFPEEERITALILHR